MFAGKRLRQAIAWRGPFVMTTQVRMHAWVQKESKMYASRDVKLRCVCLDVDP